MNNIEKGRFDIVEVNSFSQGKMIAGHVAGFEEGMVVSDLKNIDPSKYQPGKVIVLKLNEPNSNDEDGLLAYTSKLFTLQDDVLELTDKGITVVLIHVIAGLVPETPMTSYLRDAVTITRKLAPENHFNTIKPAYEYGKDVRRIIIKDVKSEVSINKSIVYDKKTMEVSPEVSKLDTLRYYHGYGIKEVMSNVCILEINPLAVIHLAGAHNTFRKNKHLIRGLDLSLSLLEHCLTPNVEEGITPRGLYHHLTNNDMLDDGYLPTEEELPLSEILTLDL